MKRRPKRVSNKGDKCRWCKQPIEWAKCQGKFIALEPGFMGFHSCFGTLGALMPKFKEHHGEQ
jgi:hypothetical protein